MSLHRNRIVGLMRLIVLMLFAGALAASPAAAHKHHHHQGEGGAAFAQAGNGHAAGTHGQAAAQPGSHTAPMATMGDEDEHEDRSKMTTAARAVDWLGRLHPVIIHFPIAFLTAGLFTAFVGRRRPAFAKPVQFLVVAGGLLAPVAVLLGWLDAGFSLTDTDPLLRVHRWLGTGIGIGGLALALWALRRPDEDRRQGMIIALAAITVAIVVQGWYGGAMVHGADHMSW